MAVVSKMTSGFVLESARHPGQYVSPDSSDAPGGNFTLSPLIYQSRESAEQARDILLAFAPEEGPIDIVPCTATLTIGTPVPN